MPRDARSYLDRLQGTQASLKAIFEAARMDVAEGRDILDELERIIAVREATRYLEARDSGYREGLREMLKSNEPHDGSRDGGGTPSTAMSEA